METSTKYLLAGLGAAAVAYYFMTRDDASKKASVQQPAALPPPPAPTVTPVRPQPTPGLSIPGLGTASVPFSPNTPEVQAVLNTIQSSPEAQAAARTAQSSPEAAAVQSVLSAIPGFSF